MKAHIDQILDILVEAGYTGNRNAIKEVHIVPGDIAYVTHYISQIPNLEVSQQTIVLRQREDI